MLFKRRDKLKPHQKVRNFFAPSKGLRRGFKYIWQRISRIKATPYAIAFGVAAGSFASCTPFFGFHFIIAAVIAYAFKGNLVASALGTFVGNPLTFPIFWVINSRIGGFVLGNDVVIPLPSGKHQKHFFKGFEEMWVNLKPIIIGSVPLGLVVGAIMYFIVYRTVKLYQERRSHKFKS